MLTFPTHTTDTGIVVINMGAKLDAYTVDEFFYCIQDQLDKDNHLIVIDCAQLEYLSSVGIGTLVRIHHQAQQKDNRVIYAALPPAPLDALRLVQLDTILEIFDSIDDACAALIDCPAGQPDHPQ